MKKDNNQLMDGFNTAATISFYMVSFAVAGVALGRLADEYFGIKPWGTVIGIVLGMISGMWAIYKKVMEGK